jgi:hypothetical protein
MKCTSTRAHLLRMRNACATGAVTKPVAHSARSPKGAVRLCAGRVHGGNITDEAALPTGGSPAQVFDGSDWSGGALDRGRTRLKTENGNPQ